MKHLKRNMVSILAMLVCCICLGMAGRPLKTDAAASWSTLKFGEWLRTDSITKTNDTRYYTITVPKPGYVTVYCNSFFSSCGVWLLTEDMQTTILSNFWMYGDESTPSTYKGGQWIEAGTYLIKVKGNSGSFGNFHLKAEYRAAGNNETEPNNTYAQATNLTFNKKMRGLRSAQDADDYYVFTIPEERELTLQVTSYIYGAGVEVRNSDMEVVKTYSWIYGTEEAPTTINLNLDLTKGKYYIHVYSSGRTGYYDLTLKPVKVLASEIVVSRTAATIYKGNKLQLRAYVSPSNATNRTVKWTTNNPYVVTVSSTGLVTATGAGKATITARTTDGTKLTASCQITVRNKTLNVTPAKLTLVKGKYRTLKVTGAPAVTTKNVKLYTMNSRIATVSGTGRIYARNVGTCKIKVVGNGLTKYVTLTVKAR